MSTLYYRIRRGNLYSSAIGRDLGRSQSTVVEELQQLVECGILFKEERKKSQEYSLTFSGLYPFVVRRLKELLDSNDTKFRQDAIKEIFSEDLFWRFLSDYSKELARGKKNVNRHTKKTLMEIVLSFFQAVVLQSLNLRSRLYIKDVDEVSASIVNFARQVSNAANIVECRSVENLFR